MSIRILSGVSGSGKTTRAQAVYSSHLRKSADEFFFNPKTRQYEFDPTKLQEAHADCLNRFMKALAYGWPIVIDNTNCSAWEISPYVAIAAATDPSIDIAIDVLCVAPDVAFKRTSKLGIALTTIEAQYGRLTTMVMGHLSDHWNVRLFDDNGEKVDRGYLLNQVAEYAIRKADKAFSATVQGA